MSALAWRVTVDVVDPLKMYLVNITEGNILMDNKYLKNFMPFYLFEGTSTATFFGFLSPGLAVPQAALANDDVRGAMS